MSYLPGLKSDGAEGLIIPGHLRVQNYIAGIEEVFAASGGSITTSTETPIGTLSGQGCSSVTFPPVLGNLSFSVPVSGLYRHEFSIPVTAGGTGGDIEVRALQDGGVIETWTFTLAAGVKTVLNGWQFDFFDVSNLSQYAVYQANGDGWSISAQPLLYLNLKA